jgi:hypothetical protein
MILRVFLLVLSIVLSVAAQTASNQLHFSVSVDNRPGAPVALKGFTNRGLDEKGRGPTVLIENTSGRSVTAVRLKTIEVGKFCGQDTLVKMTGDQGMSSVSLSPNQTALWDRTLLSPSALIHSAKHYGADSVEISVYVFEVYFADGASWTVSEEPASSVRWVGSLDLPCDNEVTGIYATRALQTARRSNTETVVQKYEVTCTIKDTIAMCPDSM